MQFKPWFHLQEMPAQITLAGDWQTAKQRVKSKQLDKTNAVRFKDNKNTYSYPSDQNVIPIQGVHRWPHTTISQLTNPKAIKKIVHKFENVPEQFNIGMVLTPKSHQSGMTDKGIVSPEFVRTQLELTPEDFQIYPNKINVLFMRNDGGDMVDMTAWIIIHRFGHALGYGNVGSISKHGSYEARQKEPINVLSQQLMQTFEKIKKEGYDTTPLLKSTLELINKMGTMRSAREGRILNTDDFACELLAQYTFYRKIWFNSLPKELDGNPLIDPSVKRYLNIEDWTAILQGILANAQGKIYVM